MHSRICGSGSRKIKGHEPVLIRRLSARDKLNGEANWEQPSAHELS